jgi:hypothetical protein
MGRSGLPTSLGKKPTEAFGGFLQYQTSRSFCHFLFLFYFDFFTFPYFANLGDAVSEVWSKGLLIDGELPSLLRSMVERIEITLLVVILDAPPIK